MCIESYLGYLKHKRTFWRTSKGDGIHVICVGDWPSDKRWSSVDILFWICVARVKGSKMVKDSNAMTSNK